MVPPGGGVGTHGTVGNNSPYRRLHAIDPKITRRRLAMKFTRYIKTIGIAALAACLFAPSASAQLQSSGDRNCQTAWGNSPASHYCPNATVGYTGFSSDPATSQKCRVSVTCSVVVDEETFSGSFTVYQSTSDTALLSLCFEHDRRKDEYNLRMRLDCVPPLLDAGQAAHLGFPDHKK